MLAKRELLGLVTLESSSLGLPHEGLFHSRFMHVTFLLLRATVQVPKSVLLLLCIRDSVSVAYGSRIWISLRYSNNFIFKHRAVSIYTYIYMF